MNATTTDRTFAPRAGKLTLATLVSLASLPATALAASWPERPATMEAVEAPALIGSSMDDDAAGPLTTVKNPALAGMPAPQPAAELIGDVVVILGTGGDDTAEVRFDSVGDLRVQLGGAVSTFPASAVASVHFAGYDGDDRFTNLTDVPSTANGGPGQDTLTGGSGPDILYGGAGDDGLYGGAGDDVIGGAGGADVLWGGTGADVMRGGSGPDVLHGGGGADTLIGGSGDDILYGEGGQDLLVAVGLGADTLVGGAQWDSLWADSTDTIADASTNELARGYVHQIDQFEQFDPFDNAVVGGVASEIGLDPYGEDLPDPTPEADDGPVTLESFAGRPLFPFDGPTKDDVFQGGVGDCYFMSALSSIADADPAAIRNMVVDLTDGTYAVRFYLGGVAHYVRVDADLWVDAAGSLVYADLGQDDALWVPIVEKAYAFFRRDKGTYASIQGGDGTLSEHLDMDHPKLTIDDGVDPQDVIAWFGAGQAPGPIADAVDAGVSELLEWVETEQAAGNAVTAGSRAGVSDNTPLQLDDPTTSSNESTYRRGQHVYMVDHLLYDSTGAPSGIVLRDPYGPYRTISDPARIYFCLSVAAYTL